MYVFNIIVGVLIILTGISNFFLAFKKKNEIRGFLVYYTIIKKKECMKIQLYGSIFASLVAFSSGILKIIYPENHLLFYMMVMFYIFINYGIKLVCEFKGYIQE